MCVGSDAHLQTRTLPPRGLGSASGLSDMLSNTSLSPQTQRSGGPSGASQAAGEGGRGQSAAVRQGAHGLRAAPGIVGVARPTLGGAATSCGRGHPGLWAGPAWAAEETVLEPGNGVTASSQVRVCLGGPRLAGKRVGHLCCQRQQFRGGSLRLPLAQNHPQLSLVLPILGLCILSLPPAAMQPSAPRAPFLAPC